ncbi:MAG: DNA translocase FtsK 4TM domain-containing protein [Candidatus Krumholzibacteria bacterium]|nr:DNA translocase FtsK 4TM domain-containing protein [Candidatus Krumholzibacteria bacterium]
MRITKGLLLLLFAAFIGVALGSIHAEDWGAFWHVQNLCGPIGAHVAGALRLLFGPALSWFWPLFILFFAVLVFRKMEAARQLRRIICSLLLLVVVSAIAAVFGGEGAGGLAGLKTLGFLRLISGRIGSGLILVAALLVVSFLLLPGALESLIARLRRMRMPHFSFPDRKRREPSVKQKKSKKEKTVPEIAVIVDGEEQTVAVRRGRQKEEKDEDLPPRITVSETAIMRSEDEVGISDIEGVPGVSAAAAGDMPLPDLSLLDDCEARGVSYSTDDLIARSGIIETKLKDYGLDGKIQEVRPGPVVTTFEFVPAAGVKVSQIASRADDISLALAARSIRIQAPIPGRGAVGIEVPNPEASLVSLKELLEHYPKDKEGLIVPFGKTVTGEPYFADISEMPHLLIAGATGSGKSVCINTIICSLLFHHTPATCRFILVDPKRLELIAYNNIPHLLHPVITEAKTVLKILQWLTVEMDRRYKLLASVGVKNIQSFNRKVADEEVLHPETQERLSGLPYYVTIIDELADIMVMMGNEIYPPITRLSQMARAVGIHLVFATQRPSVDVVTGLIKANFPSRLAFQVTSKTDSRTILDANGAEKLLGNGDMLYLPKNLPHPIRLQGAFISEAESERVASYWKKFSSGEEALDLADETPVTGDDDAPIDDELFQKARELVVIHQQGSISLLQRRLRVGYARAARLIDMLEQAGVVGPFEGSKARRVLVSREKYDEN